MIAQFDIDMMQKALKEADLAAGKNEVPIGAVAVLNGECIATAHNLRESSQDPFAHAECLLLKKVSERLNCWRLEGLEVYVTCEPCPMCAGALLQARVKRLVYGCKDPKAGVCGSLYNFLEDKRFNHQVEVLGGVLEEECAERLSLFFRQLRKLCKRTIEIW